MYIIDSVALSFGSCTFRNNLASEKGGIMFVTRKTPNLGVSCYISLIKSEISGSSSSDSGGAIYL
jgi:hypothetical protein